MLGGRFGCDFSPWYQGCKQSKKFYSINSRSQDGLLGVDYTLF